MSYTRIWVHAVWATHKRRKLLAEKIRKKVFQHIFDQALKKSIRMNIVNGHDDHVHCLFLLNPAQELSKTIQYLKGESSHWINKEQLISERFSWQEGYFAESICKEHVEALRTYILNQDEHHRTVTFEEEFKQVFDELFGRQDL